MWTEVQPANGSLPIPTPRRTDQNRHLPRIEGREQIGSYPLTHDQSPGLEHLDQIGREIGRTGQDAYLHGLAPPGPCPRDRPALGRKSGTRMGWLPWEMDSAARIAGAAVSIAL